MTQAEDQRTADKRRLDEMIDIYESAVQSVRQLIARIDAGDEEVPKKLGAQISTLFDLYVRIRKGQDDFNEKFGKADADITDIARIRDEIGRKLDRIRERS